MSLEDVVAYGRTIQVPKGRDKENVLHGQKSRSRCLINRITLRCNENSVILTPINCHSSITCATPTRFAVAIDVETQIQIDGHSASSNNSRRSFHCIADPVLSV
jgi:hypothetical protein